MKCPQTRPLLWLFTNLTKLLVSKFLCLFVFLFWLSPMSIRHQDTISVRTKFIGCPTKEVTLISTLNFLFKLDIVGNHFASDLEDLCIIPQQSWSEMRETDFKCKFYCLLRSQIG